MKVVDGSSLLRDFDVLLLDLMIWWSLHTSSAEAEIGVGRGAEMVTELSWEMSRDGSCCDVRVD